MTREREYILNKRKNKFYPTTVSSILNKGKASFHPATVRSIRALKFCTILSTTTKTYYN